MVSVSGFVIGYYRNVLVAGDDNRLWITKVHIHTIWMYTLSISQNIAKYAYTEN